MGYGKCWKVPVSELQALIQNADSNDDCLVEIWHGSSELVDDAELYINLSSGWADSFPTQPPQDPA